MTTRLTLASYNIQFGRGRDMRFDIRRVADEVRRADIVAFQEVTQGWQRTGNMDQAAELAAGLGYHHAFGTGFDVDAGSTIEDGRPVRRRRTFGNMVASRWPISSTRTLLLPKRSVHGVYDMQRCVVEAVVATPAGDLRVYSGHLSHISSGQRVIQVRALMDFIMDAPVNGSAWDHTHTPDWTEGMEAPLLPEPAVLMGDMNFTHDSPEYQLVCGELDPHFGRISHARTLVDAWTLAGHDVADGVSIVDTPWGDIRIDHVFVTRSIAPFVRSMTIDSSAQGSDHFPVFAELELPDGALPRKNGPP